MTQTNGTICAEEYVVKRGDSFYLIAHKLGVPLRDLLAANSNIHPARLMVGDVLCIPREEDDTPQPPNTEVVIPPQEPDVNSDFNVGILPDPTLGCPETEQFTVEPGQTVADLQLRNLVSRHTLESANPGVDFENLSTGQKLCIPMDNVPCRLPETYELEDGETLESVAVKFNLPVASLLRANPCLAPQDFEGDVTIILPR